MGIARISKKQNKINEIMIYSPTKIYPSAGHHNADAGAVANGYKEADLTKEARNIIAGHSKAEDLIMDKDYETNRQYQSRIKPGDGSVLLDIHFNAGSPTAGGTECFVNDRDFQNKSSLSYKMASEICQLTAKVLGVNNRGVKSEKVSQHKRLGILNLGAGVSVLWEICFITSALDMQSYQMKKEELLKGVAEILKKYDDMK